MRRASVSRDCLMEEVASEVAALVAEALAVAGKVSLNKEILF